MTEWFKDQYDSTVDEDCDDFFTTLRQVVAPIDNDSVAVAVVVAMKECDSIDGNYPMLGWIQCLLMRLTLDK